MSELIKSRFIDFGIGTDQVNARDIPANFTPNKYIAAQVGSEGNDKISAHFKGVDTYLSKITPQNTIWVKKNPNQGEFLTVEAALASITTNSSTNIFVIRVGPGIYQENPLVMKPYVFIIGEDDSASILEAIDPTQPLITGSSSSEIKHIQLRGPTDPGVPLIYYTGTTLSQATFNIIECAFYNCDLIYNIVGNNSFPTIVRSEGCRVTSQNSVNAVMNVDGSAAMPTVVFLGGFVFRQISPPYPSYMFDLAGPNAQVVLEGVLIVSNSAVTHGIDLEDGCKLDIISTAITGVDVGIHVHNVGAGPTIQTSNVIFRDCVTDILIEHPGTTGSLNGIAASNKINIDPAANVTLVLADLENGGLIVAGPISFGRKAEYLTNVLDLLEGEPAMGVMDGGALSNGGGFTVNVASGFGYVMTQNFPDHRIKRIEWNNTSIVLSANQDVYIYFNSSGVLTSAASISNSSFTILLGRVVTNSSGIELIDESPIYTHHPTNHFDKLFRDALGPIYDSGSIVTENATPFKIDITSGVYFFSLTRFAPIGGTAKTFTQYYRDGIGGWNKSSTDLIVSGSYDNNSGSLAALTTGYYAKHVLYCNGDNSNEQYFLVVAQAEYSALAAAEDAPLPNPPSWIKDSVVPIAAIIVRQGQANIIEVIDIRPRIGFRSSGVSASSDHGSLLGLADDDHPQYLLVGGTRAMSGNLDMGTNSIVNVNLVDGVDVSAHASRHLPNGADAITTAIASGLNANSVNAVGTANSLSRSDHIHAIATGAASTQTPAQINAAGTSANLARADHVHNIPVGTPVTIGSANTEGVAATFSRADHIHDHGNLAGGSLHALATGSVAGFMSAADKTKLDGIGGNRIIKSGRVLAASFTGTPKTATVTFGTAFPNTDYSFFVLGTDVRSWSWESKLAGSIVINSNANQALTGDVLWFAISYGESVE